MSEPCQNGGQCLNEPGGYICICPDGLEGDIPIRVKKVVEFHGASCEIRKLFTYLGHG